MLHQCFEYPNQPHNKNLKRKLNEVSSITHQYPIVMNKKSLGDTTYETKLEKAKYALSIVRKIRTSIYATSKDLVQPRTAELVTANMLEKDLVQPSRYE
ncbi:hypothetical protein QYM36_006686, partial [Artemia franciscana]